MQAYCMKCRKKVDIKNPRAIMMKNGRPQPKVNVQAAERKCSE